MPENDLLRPSLAAGDATRVSIYSTTTGFMAAYFGGPLGAASIALLNSHRIGRLAKDWPFALLALLAVPIYFHWLQLGGGQQWLTATIGAWSTPYFYRLLGVLFFGLAYGLHRSQYRNMALIGLKPTPGWIPGLAAIVVGGAYSFLVARLLVDGP